ncbi:MAG: hypothetical protein DME22_04830 [Verrucomicrobia bacterium]|nr:MAG: hypothetical protein DME22_04830 [Verrucomicrobiota bacterium]
MPAICTNRKFKALTLVEMLVVIAVIGVLFAVFINAVSHHRFRPTWVKCTNNLKAIGFSFRIFANDHGDAFPMGVSTIKGGSMEYVTTDEVFRHFRAMSNELSMPKVLVCPADNRKAALSFAVLSNTNISYFLGANVADTLPQSLLAGDRNLTTNSVPVGAGLLDLTTNVTVGWTAALHKHSGNVVLGDGSVQQFTNARLQEQSAHSGVATNRLLIP